MFPLATLIINRLSPAADDAHRWVECAKMSDYIKKGINIVQRIFIFINHIFLWNSSDWLFGIEGKLAIQRLYLPLPIFPPTTPQSHKFIKVN